MGKRKRSRNSQSPRPDGGGKWHHAYNGIPAVRPDKKDDGGSFYRDRAPSTQDHLAPGRVSGHIDVSITVATPTVPGQQTAGSAGLRQVVVASRSGNPLGARSWEDATIPTTSLKGMLSSAYEAVTASRMRVFREHDHVLTHRRTTQESTFLYPVLLVPTEDGNGLRAQVMLGMNSVPKSRRDWNNPRYVCTAVLPDSLHAAVKFLDDHKREIFTGGKKKQTGKNDIAKQRLSSLRKVTRNLTEIRFSARIEKFYNKKRVVVHKIGTQPYFAPKSGNQETKKLHGYAVRLTPSPNRPLSQNKHSEFVFFDSNEPSTFLPVDDDVLNNLVEVLHSYLVNIRTLEQQELRRRGCGANNDSNTRQSSDPSTWLVDILDKGKYGAPGRYASREQIRSFLETYVRQPDNTKHGIPLFATVGWDTTKENRRERTQNYITQPLPGRQASGRYRRRSRRSGRGGTYLPRPAHGGVFSW